LTRAIALAIFLHCERISADNSLASWNDTAAKKAIIDFVGRVTKERSPGFVKSEERTATFDVALWAFQVLYTRERVEALLIDMKRRLENHFSV
jgi:hypothetical protein